MLPLTPVGANGKPLGGTCMSNVGDGGGAGCDTCDFLDDKMTFLREETKRTASPRPTASTTARATST